jgi:hypothetical protein
MPRALSSGSESVLASGASRASIMIFKLPVTVTVTQAYSDSGAVS